MRRVLHENSIGLRVRICDIIATESGSRDIELGNRQAVMTEASLGVIGPVPLERYEVRSNEYQAQYNSPASLVVPGRPCVRPSSTVARFSYSPGSVPSRQLVRVPVREQIACGGTMHTIVDWAR